MKIAKSYILYVNGFTNVASYARVGSSFDRLSAKFTVGKVYECDFHELMHNLRILRKSGKTLIKRK